MIATTASINYGEIDWLVLDEQDGMSLIIAKNIIEKHAYNSDRFCDAWAHSTLHTYLGGDRFLLSAEEASRYFANDTTRIALFQGLPRAWWLRDTGIKNHAAFVSKDGKINAHGYRVDCAWCGVRPAMWIKLKK